MVLGWRGHFLGDSRVFLFFASLLEPIFKFLLDFPVSFRRVVLVFFVLGRVTFDSIGFCTVFSCAGASSGSPERFATVL